MNFKNYLNETSSGENRKLAKVDSAVKRGSNPAQNPELKQAEDNASRSQEDGLNRLKYKLRKGKKLGGHDEPRGPGKKTAKKALKRLRRGRELTQQQKDSLKHKFKNKDALNAAADEMGSTYVGDKVYTEGSGSKKRLKRKGDALIKKAGGIEKAVNAEYGANPELSVHLKKERRNEKEGDKRNTAAKTKKALLGKGIKNRREYLGRIERKRSMHEATQGEEEVSGADRRKEDKEKKQTARKQIRGALDRVIHIKGDKKKRLDIANKVASQQKAELKKVNKDTRVSIRARRADIKQAEKTKETELEKNKRNRISRVGREATNRLKTARRDLARASRDA